MSLESEIKEYAKDGDAFRFKGQVPVSSHITAAGLFVALGSTMHYLHNQILSQNQRTDLSGIIFLGNMARYMSIGMALYFGIGAINHYIKRRRIFSNIESNIELLRSYEGNFRHDHPEEPQTQQEFDALRTIKMVADSRLTDHQLLAYLRFTNQVLNPGFEIIAKSQGSYLSLPNGPLRNA